MGNPILDTAANEFSLQRRQSAGSLSVLEQPNYKYKPQSQVPRRRAIVPDLYYTQHIFPEGTGNEFPSRRRKSTGDASELRLPDFTASLAREPLKRGAAMRTSGSCASTRSSSLSALSNSRPTTPDSPVEKLKATMDLRTCELAAKYHLTPDVVRKIMRHFSFGSYTSSVDEHELDGIICHVLKIDTVDPDVLQSAYRTIKMSDDVIEGFLQWYINRDAFAHAVTQVTGSIPVQGKRISEKLLSDLSMRYAISRATVDKIKQKFVYYDTDRSNLIDKRKFKAMLRAVLKHKSTDKLDPQVVQRTWKDADKDGTGSIDFEEYVDWFLTYFDVHTDDPLEFKLKPSVAVLRSL
eukprot:gnl/TRDRNA2_/TRDRNA2_176838_c0_seq10.p1 gnl/TRDRNA2_/TRDRNA2_176838_c0~~gnl/TRDRNA2_/TRDRNA2_176838_c0_seq10.p1  ORF type:complete len:368 (-),score=42.60 gnl/TRDRNA2_/TRDRNA2_176838_c0_seq10:757-1809(-)